MPQDHSVAAREGRRPAVPKGRPAGILSGLAAWMDRTWELRAWRAVILALALLLWLPALFVLGIVLGINPIVRLGVEKLGSTSLRVPVELRRARISFAGAARLDAFRIANPGGYEGPDAASFRGLYARVPIPSAFRPVIDIPELTVLRPELRIELGGKGRPSNWGALMKNLEDSLPKKAEPPEPAREKEFIVRRLRIVEPVIHFRAAWMSREITLHLKDIELEGVGNAPGSKSKAYVVLAAVLQAVLTGGLKEGKDLPSDVTGPLGKELSESVKAFRSVLKAPR